MQPLEIIELAESISRAADVKTLRRAKIALSRDEWNAMRDYLGAFEPITTWPVPEREPVTRLVVFGVELLVL